MNFSLKTSLLRLVQGFIIGAGGILPGISGGVLSVIFGIYRPVMEVLAHPLNGCAAIFPSCCRSAPARSSASCAAAG